MPSRKNKAIGRESLIAFNSPFFTKSFLSNNFLLYHETTEDCHGFGMRKFAEEG